jgi:hypothetical protein
MRSYDRALLAHREDTACNRDWHGVTPAEALAPALGVEVAHACARSAELHAGEIDETSGE